MFWCSGKAFWQSCDKRFSRAGPRLLAAPGPGPRAPMQPQGQEVRKSRQSRWSEIAAHQKL